MSWLICTWLITIDSLQNSILLQCYMIFDYIFKIIVNDRVWFVSAAHSIRLFPGSFRPVVDMMYTFISVILLRVSLKRFLGN